MLGRQVLTEDENENENENIPLYYHVVDNFQIQFGREEFCLVTGLKFGVENWTDYNDESEPIPFRRRVFSSSLDGQPIRGKHVAALINSEEFKKLDDNDAVSLLVMSIHIAFSVIDGWDNYPWGSHVWPTLYKQLKDANVRRWPALYATQPRNEDEVEKKSYSLVGFLWAFKTWILESFRAATNDYYTRYRRLPRIVAWSSKNKFYLRMLRPFLHGVPSAFQTLANSSSFFNMATPSNLQTSVQRNWQTPSNWQTPNSSYLGTPNSQPPIPSHPGTNCYMKGYKLPSSFWPQLVPHLCTYRSDRSWPEGWLSGDHMNSWIQILIRERAENANWTLSKSGTICVHTENNRFMILTDPHIIGTLDGSMRPYPAWKDVNWVLILLIYFFKRWVIGGSICSNPENVRLNVLMKLQEALDEEALLEEQILTLMHHFANRFTDRRVEINNLMVLQDHPLIDYGKYALGCMTGANMKKCVYLKSVRDELLRSMEEKRQLITNYRDM
ncbi:hypothetical protein Tco_0711978 [Tanacetum coccineum]